MAYRVAWSITSNKSSQHHLNCESTSQYLLRMIPCHYLFVASWVLITAYAVPEPVRNRQNPNILLFGCCTCCVARYPGDCLALRRLRVHRRAASRRPHCKDTASAVIAIWLKFHPGNLCRQCRSTGDSVQLCEDVDINRIGPRWPPLLDQHNKFNRRDHKLRGFLIGNMFQRNCIQQARYIILLPTCHELILSRSTIYGVMKSKCHMIPCRMKYVY